MRWTRGVVLVAAIAALACSSATTEPTPANCAQWPTADACAWHPQCVVLMGTEFDTVDQCSYAPQPMGCVDAACADGSATYTTSTRPGNGWVFSGRCSLGPFPGVDAYEVIAPPTPAFVQAAMAPRCVPCAQRELVACGRGCLTIRGRRVDTRASCTLSEQALTCTADSACLDMPAPHLAQAPDGSYWLFPNGCRPASWTPVNVISPELMSAQSSDCLP